MELEHKILPLSISENKALGEGWFVAGMASTFMGTPDTFGDLVAKGAFAESLKVRPNVPLLWQHDMAEPIGKTVSLSENDAGLFGHWTLVPTPTGRKAHQLLDAELVAGLSIGFVTKEAEYTDDGTRILKVVDLYEVSLVTIPANSSAVVTSFKADAPLHLLLKETADLLGERMDMAEALHQRRAAEGRDLTDRIDAALDELATAAKAAIDRREALRVGESNAKGPDFGEIGLQLAERRLRLGRHLLKESA